MKPDTPATRLMKRATLSAICFYLCLLLFSVLQSISIPSFIAGFVDTLKLVLFALLILVYPAYCSYKIADLKDALLSKKWRFLQLSHIVCCMPLWYAFFTSKVSVSAESAEPVETIATRLFVVLVIVSLAPLIGFIVERFVRNQRWNRL